jgi:biopolymer transport protein ExbB
MNANPYGIAALWVQGDYVTRGLVVILLTMSVLSWYVIVTHAWRLLRNRRRSRAAVAFWHEQTMSAGMQCLEGGRENPFRLLAEESLAAVEHHRGNQADLHGQLSLSDWLVSCLRGAVDEATESMQRGLPILASVGSTAPFVGLFGTVWGIYHALVGIGVAGQASIDKIAGPVGEALIMTAGGLAVAIPAVLAYNALIRGNREVIGKLNRFAHDLHAFYVTGSPVNKGTRRSPAAGVSGTAPLPTRDH